MHSLLPLPRVSVISSIKRSVNKDSIKPIAASINAYGKIMPNVSKLKGTLGMLNLGKPPAIDATSPTTLVSMFSPITARETATIATNDDGMS